MLKRVLQIAVVFVVVCGAFAWALVHAQGIDPDSWPERTDGRVRMDKRGVPTISADSWLEAVELQGYVVASERMFQMDLLRRYAGGRLSEWFGPKALDLDKRRRSEDWMGVADRAYKDLSEEERAHVDAYTAGVNRFIDELGYRWGTEYLLLRTRPEHWQSRDSLLVLLQMCEQLTASAEREAAQFVWRRALPKEWQAFFLPEEDPDNVPLFGKSDGQPLEIPFESAIPSAPIATAPEASDVPGIAGSNNWAWCGKSGCFLANDPHLGATVPQTWYAVRLRLGPDRWVAGVSLPGLPGVAIGMNPHLAWAFTNVGEDVDDYLEETLSEDGKSYLARTAPDGTPVYLPVEQKSSTIEVRGASDVTVTSRFTHRGPLSRRDGLGDGEYSRQWLPLKPKMLRLPIALNRAKSWDEINDALDSMAVPAQNVVIVDRAGRIGYRTSGTGVLRRVSGRVINPAIEGEWLGLEPHSKRRRMYEYAITSTSVEPTSIVTANQRIWVDEFGHRWGDERRAYRIREALAERSDFTRRDMEELQLDTKSRFHMKLVSWLTPRVQPKNDKEREMLDRWKRFDGYAAKHRHTFSEAIAVEEAVVAAASDRVREHFGIERGARYSHRLWRTWLLAVLEAENGFSVFGFDEAELVRHLVDAALAAPKDHGVANHWAAQHPFADRIPVIGGYFSVGEPEQVGYRGLVRVEEPRFGASVRVVFDLRNPAESTWVFPVGQSGHPRSAHYSDFQPDWVSNRRAKVLPPGIDWGLRSP